MSLSASQNELRFLLDENVDKELFKFLKKQEYDITLAPKGFTNGELAKISKSEQRILVTNDKHFTNSSVFPKEKIFSIIWLRIPQDKTELLIKSFSSMLKEKSKIKDFQWNLITLESNKFESVPIPSSLQPANQN